MLSKLIQKLAILRSAAAVLFVMLLTACLVMYFSGTLTTDKIGYMADVLRGELPEPEPKGKKYTRSEARTEADKVLEESIELSESLKKISEEGPIKAGMGSSSLEIIRTSLDRIMERIDKDQAELKAKVAAFEEEKKKYREALQDAEFKRKVEVIGKLDAEQAAQSLKDWDDETVILIFMELKATKLGEIITELNQFPAKVGIGMRGAELLNKLGEKKDDDVGGKASSEKTSVEES